MASIFAKIKQKAGSLSAGTTKYARFNLSITIPVAISVTSTPPRIQYLVGYSPQTIRDAIMGQIPTLALADLTVFTPTEAQLDTVDWGNERISTTATEDA